MNGHKNGIKVRAALFAVAISALMVSFILSPIAFTAFTMLAVSTLGFVPRFILSSTDLLYPSTERGREL